MAGLKENIVQHTLTAFRNATDALQPVLFVDRVNQGQNLVERLRMQIRGITEYLPESPAKDWNEQLTASKKNLKVNFQNVYQYDIIY